jgi:acyl-CoA thioester hydrolase
MHAAGTVNKEARMSTRFEMPFFARWADMDFNAHMRNTAFLDVAADCRMRYFESGGFTMWEFEQRQIGPVIMRDELEYRAEMRLLEAGTVDLQLAGLSADTSRFRLRNTFRRDRDGKPVAAVTSLGAWFDLTSRKPTAAPDDLAVVLRALARADDYSELPSH